MVDGIGTITIGFERPTIDPERDVVEIRFDEYYGGEFTRRSREIPVADLDVIKEVERKHDVDFLTIQRHGDGAFFVFGDADNPPIEGGACERVVVPNHLLKNDRQA